MKPALLKNPPNPWHSQQVEYLEEAPEQRLEVYEDATRSILAENDSPDLGFRWSVNPYRGCLHACAYCLSGDTRILMADGRTRALEEIAVGDAVYGTALDGSRRRYAGARVLAHWATTKPAYRVRLNDGTELVASGDHRFLSTDGWRRVTELESVAHLLGAGGSLPDVGAPLGVPARFGVRSVQPLGKVVRLFDITTTTGDFIANGVVSHNCYARPSHEYLGFGAGTDFDRRIAIKPRAPELLREAFEKRSWQGELVMFSGNTDCYQPLEASYELTRRCLQVCAEYRNPVHVITKAALIERDIDVIASLVRDAQAGVSVSIPFWDPAHARAIEPYAPTPQRRIETVRRLSAAGIPVTVNVAPLIPGLNDREMPNILEAAAEAGAKRAAMIPLRLPGAVKQVFEERLRAALPLRADKVLARTREMRGGKLYDSRFGARMTGQGEYHAAIEKLFDATSKRLGLAAGHADGSHRYAGAETSFRRPTDRGGQLRLFG